MRVANLRNCSPQRTYHSAICTRNQRRTPLRLLLLLLQLRRRRRREHRTCVWHDIPYSAVHLAGSECHTRDIETAERGWKDERASRTRCSDCRAKTKRAKQKGVNDRTSWRACRLHASPLDKTDEILEESGGMAEIAVSLPLCSQQQQTDSLSPVSCGPDEQARNNAHQRKHSPFG